MSAENWEALSFRIDGQHLTDVVRNRVIEGAWRQAIEILTNGMAGSNLDTASQILRCEKCLVGVNDCELADEDGSREEVREYLRTVNYQYAGVYYVPSNGTFWRPYAYVNSYGREDMAGREGSLEGRTRPMPWQPERDRRGFRADGRAMFYAKSPNDAVRYMDVPAVSRQVGVLWEEVLDPPAFFTGHLYVTESPEQALAQWLTVPGHSLSGVGYARLFLAPQEETSGGRRWAEKRELERELEMETPPPREPYVPEPVTDIDGIANLQSGWLSPKGEFYPCGWMEHIALAEDICRVVLKCDESSWFNGERSLEELGWWKRTMGGPEKGAWLGGGPDPTKAQKEILIHWLVKNEGKVDSMHKSLLGLEDD